MVGTMSYKLLLADDSVTIQRVIELTFADEDVKVIAVGDGQQAIDQIEAEPPDIVLADVGMPSRDGYQVAAYVKSTPRLAHIPVLLLTGAFEPVDEDRAREAGCDGVLAKPFEPQMVIARVRELLASTPPRSDGAPIGFDLDQVPDLGADLVLTVTEEAAIAPPAGDALIPEHAPVTALPESSPSELAGDVRIRRRPPVITAETPAAVGPEGGQADEGSPEAVARPLDDYFDRLDAAFATLVRPGSGAAPGAQAAGFRAAAAGRPESNLPSEEEEEQEAEPAGPVPSGDLRAEAVAPGHAAPALAEPPAGADRSPVAQAFSALLAAERGDAAVPAGPPLWPPQGLSPQAIDDIVERVTREVIERMTDRSVREAVTDAVSRIAERLIREEIDRIKATIK